MKQAMNVCSRVETLGRQLGLDTEQIHTILDTHHHENEPLSCSLGPPNYPCSYYGTISIKDFTSTKKQ